MTYTELVLTPTYIQPYIKRQGEWFWVYTCKDKPLQIKGRFHRSREQKEDISYDELDEGWKFLANPGTMNPESTWTFHIGEDRRQGPFKYKIVLVWATITHYDSYGVDTMTLHFEVK